MTSVSIQGHLTEPKLAVALSQIAGGDWVGTQVKFPGSRRRFDMAYRSGNALILIEYDGDEHYRGSLKIRDDEEKAALARSEGAKLVRIPYWIQLTGESLGFYFGVRAHIEQSFPHGFITTKYYPASFCEMGVARFRHELASLPATIRGAVIESLRARAGEHGLQYVVPTSLVDLVT